MCFNALLYAFGAFMSCNKLRNVVQLTISCRVLRAGHSESMHTNVCVCVFVMTCVDTNI